MDEIAADMREGLMAMAVSSDRSRWAGAGCRWIDRGDGSGELPVPANELFSFTEVLGRWRWSACSRACRRAAVDRSRAGRPARRVRILDEEQVGGVAEVRSRDRDHADRVGECPQWTS